MGALTDLRLTVIGNRRTLERLDRSNWPSQLKAKHIEVWERSKTRRVWWFQTLSESAIVSLSSLSCRWSTLVFFLDYENQQERSKGMIKAVGGRIDHCRFTSRRG